MVRRSSPAFSFLVIYAVAAAHAGGENPFSAAETPLLSPDASAVAFVSQTEQSVSIAVLPTSGGAPMTLATLRPPARLVAWFPDGKSLLALDGENRIWRVQTHAADKKHLLAHGSDCALSPNGSTFALLDNAQIAFLDIASLRETPVPRTNAEGWRLGGWLDDDTLLALTGEGSLVRIQRNPPGKVEMIVKHESMMNSFIAVSVERGARRAMALTSDDMQLADPQNPTSIWVFSADGAKKLAVIPNARRPVWTANGRLFFWRRAQVMVTHDFENCRPLAKAEGWDVSPDGSTLVVARPAAEGSGLCRIAIHDETPSAPVPLLAPGAGMPH